MAANHLGATCAIKLTRSGPARVSTRLAIGLCTHGSILICWPKNSSRLLDTFFRNPCILVPDTETQSSVNGVAQGYIREKEQGLWHSLLSLWFSLASTQRKGEWDVGIGNATLACADYTGRKRTQTRRCPWTINYREKWNQDNQQIHGPQENLFSMKGDQMLLTDFKGSSFVDDTWFISIMSF